MMSYTHIMLTLVSVGLIDEGGYMVTFKGSTCIICDAAHTMVGCFLKREGLYQVDTNHAESVSTSLADASLSMTDAHWCLGHISPDAVRLLCKSGIITGITLHLGTEIATCNSCAYAKMTCKPVSKGRSGKHADSPGGDVHTDMWGPSPVKSLGRKQYYISFTDDKACYMWVYLLALKSEALKATFNLSPG